MTSSSASVRVVSQYGLYELPEEGHHLPAGVAQPQTTARHAHCVAQPSRHRRGRRRFESYSRARPGGGGLTARCPAVSVSACALHVLAIAIICSCQHSFARGAVTFNDTLPRSADCSSQHAITILLCVNNMQGRHLVKRQACAARRPLTSCTFLPRAAASRRRIPQTTISG